MMIRTLLTAVLLALTSQAWASNDLTSNPLIIDTAASTVITSARYDVTAMVWDCGSACAQADILTLKNAAGNVVVNMTGLATTVQSTYGMIWPTPFRIQGLIMTTLGHGKLYIYYVP